jgi:hypothetical protein
MPALTGLQVGLEELTLLAVAPFFVFHPQQAH